MLEKTNYKVYLSYAVLFLVYLICSLSYSPFFENLGSDKEVFQYMGMLIDANQHPYSDAFDHKPPVIYLLNYLGFLISPNSTWGIFIILNILGFVSALLVYLLAYKKFQSFILPLLIGVSFIHINNSNAILQEGNLTRQLTAFFTTWLLFIIFNFKSTKITSFLVGTLMGIVFFTQQNEILGGAILMLYYLLFDKKFILYTFGRIVTNVAFFLMGFLLPTIVVLLIINHWNNHDYFINQVFLFNLNSYIQDRPFVSKVAAVIYKFASIAYVNKVLLVISLVTGINLLVSRIKEKKWQIDYRLIIIVVAFIFQVISTSISGQVYGHYFLMFIPFIICLFIFSYNGEDYKHHTYIPFILGGVICYHAAKKLDYQKPDNKLMEILTKEVASVKDTPGQFYSLNHRYLRVNFNLNITSPSKWIYLLYLNETIAKELMEDLCANNTQYILLDITDNDILPQELKSFIVRNYSQIMIHKEFILFKKNNRSMFRD